MGSKIFNAVVVLLWLGTMAWLFVTNIIPAYISDPAPTIGLGKDPPAIYWEMFIDAKPLGWSASKRVRGAEGDSAVFSRIKMHNIPLSKMVPQAFRMMLPTKKNLTVEIFSQTLFDSLNHLSRIKIAAKINNQPSLFKVFGKVNGKKLDITYHASDLKNTFSYPIPESLLTTKFSPTDRLIQVYKGRKWKEQVLSPFKGSLEEIEAEVINEETIIHQGEKRRTRHVIYRTLTRAGISEDDRIQAEAWIGEDGTVLRKKMYLLNTCIKFERMLDKESIKHAVEILKKENLSL